MAGTRTLKVEIVGDARGFQRSVNEIEGHTRRLSAGFSKFSTLVAGGFAALGGAAIVGGLRDVVNEAREAERVGRQTAAVIKSTGGVANVSAKDIDRLTGALSRKVGVDDDLIASGANLLLTFTNVRNETGRNNDIFNQATRAAVDLAAAMNQGEVTAEGLQSANIQLGKALNDPIRGVTALTRVGVSFTQAQKDQIQALVEAGDTMGAQKIILGELKTEFEGTAAAAADPFQRLNVTLGNVKETLGKALLPTLQRVADWINDTLIPAAQRWWKDNGPKFTKAFQDAADTAADIWHTVEDDVIPVLKTLGEKTIKAVTDGIDELTQAWKDNKEAFNQLGDDFKDAKPAWDAFAWLLRRLTTDEIPNFVKQLGWIGRAFHIAWSAVVTANKAIFNSVIWMVRGVLTAFYGLVSSVPGGKNSGFGRSLKNGIDQLQTFRDRFNAEMDKLKDEQVKVTARAGISWTAEAATFRRQAGRMAAGGPVDGPGTTTSDSVPVWLSRGEFVVNAAAAAQHHDMLEAINGAPRMAQGGDVIPRLSLPRVPPASTIQPIVEGLARGLGAAVGRGLMKAMAAAFTAGGGNWGSGSWQRAIAELRQDAVPFSIVSTYRPGARTHASGAVSFHALNRAVDLTGPNMLRIWASLTDTNPTELIYSGAPMYKSRRGWRPIGALDPITLADHWNHVHAAYKRGGLIPEDVFGIGRSGRTYGFHGGETVIPQGGGITVVINIGTVLGGDARRVARELEPAIRNALKASLGREGKPLAKQL